LIKLFLEIIILFSIGAIFSSKIKLNLNGLENISNFVLYVYVPSLIIDSTIAAKNIIKQSFDLFIYIILSAIIFIVLSNIYCYLRSYTGDKRRLILAASTLMNCGFFGIPVADIISGGMLKEYATFYTVIYTPIIAIYSQYLFKNVESKNILSFVKDPYLICFVIGIILSFASGFVNLNFLISPISKLSQSTSYMMLILMGMYLVCLKEKLNVMAIEASILRYCMGAFSILFYTHLFHNMDINYKNTLILQGLTPIGILPYFISVRNGYQIDGFKSAIILSTLLWFLANSLLFIFGVVI